MIRIKAKTPTPPVPPAAPRAHRRHPERSIAGALAGLDALVFRAAQIGDRAEAVAAAIRGDASLAPFGEALVPPASGVVEQIEALDAGLAHHLDRIAAALERAASGLG